MGRLPMVEQLARAPTWPTALRCGEEKAPLPFAGLIWRTELTLTPIGSPGCGEGQASLRGYSCI